MHTDKDDKPSDISIIYHIIAQGWTLKLICIIEKGSEQRDKR